MEDQQKLEQMVNELNMYKSQAELLQQEIENVQQTIAEVNTLESTIEDMKKKDNVEALVPVGAGSFMNAEIKNDNKIVMSIGAGVAVTKNYDEAKEELFRQSIERLKSCNDIYFKGKKNLTEEIYKNE